jgi:hypothetical protein
MADDMDVDVPETGDKKGSKARFEVKKVSELFWFLCHSPTLSV